MNTVCTSGGSVALLWWVVPAVLAALLAGATGCDFHPGAGASQPEHEKTSGDTPAPATVIALGTADCEGGVISLSPSVPGRVAAVPVHENEAVAAGGPLLRLDDAPARIQVREAEAALRASEAQAVEIANAPEQHRLLVAQQEAAVAAAGHDLAAARSVAERKRALARTRAIGQEEADAAAELARKCEAAEQAERAKLEGIRLRDPRQEVTRAQADVAAKRAQLDRARRALEDCELHAPVAGTVLRILTHVGELAGPQSIQPALVFRPAGMDIVRAEVDQEFAAGIQVGQRVSVRDEAHSAGPAWTGQVARIAGWYGPRRTVLPETLRLQEARTLECTISLDGGQAPLRIGQRVRVAFLNGP